MGSSVPGRAGFSFSVSISTMQLFIDDLLQPWIPNVAIICLISLLYIPYYNMVSDVMRQ